MIPQYDTCFPSICHAPIQYNFTQMSSSPARHPIPYNCSTMAPSSPLVFLVVLYTVLGLSWDYPGTACGTTGHPSILHCEYYTCTCVYVRVCTMNIMQSFTCRSFYLALFRHLCYIGRKGELFLGHFTYTDVYMYSMCYWV